MKICLYGICKNELKFIDRCFNSLNDADYICILDTGSTDGTYEYLKELERNNPKKFIINQQIVSPFRFDTARNLAMHFIPDDTDVCISVDMDDVFADGWREIIEEDINQGYTKILGTYDHIDDGIHTAQTIADRVHLYNSAHGEGALHERIVCDKQVQKTDSRFIIYHMRDHLKDRHELYLDCARQDAANTDYGKLCYMYECYNSGKHTESLALGLELCNKFKKNNSEYYTRKTIMFVADLCNEFNDMAKYQELCEEALTINKYNTFFEDYGFYDGLIEAALADIYYGQGDKQTACYYIRKAISLSPDNSAYAEKLAQYESSEQITLEGDIMTEETKKYLELAQDAYKKKNLVAAVSYIDTCHYIGSTAEIETLRDRYFKEYRDGATSKTYEKTKVAVYAITKNEIKFVDKWYKSMSEADYIVVLDTGSTDGTYERFQELAKKDPRLIVGQQVFSPWRFDLPRNIAMSLVPEDANILLSTDLDELLEPGWYKDLTTNWIEGIHSRATYRYAWSHNPSGAPGRLFWYNKVHNWSWIWRYPVHELLYSVDTYSEDYTEEQNTTLGVMFLHHYPDITKSRGNYLPLLEQRATEDDADYYGLIYLAHEYNYRGKYQKSIYTLNRVLKREEIQDDYIIKASCYLFMGDDYRELNEPEKAIESYKKAIEINKYYREPYMNLAEVYLSLKQWQDAIDIIKQGLRDSVRQYTWLERDISWTYQPYDLLCLAYYYNGEKLKALGCAYKAAAVEPSEQRLVDNIKSTLEGMGNEDW